MRMMQVKLRSLTSPPASPHKDDLHDVEVARKPGVTTTSLQGLDFPHDHPALMSECIELYFLRLNIFLPRLHRPAFERAVVDGLHLRDGGFAATLSLVCAIGSRWSADPTLAEQGLDCGWKWFDQVQLAGKRLLGQANLYDLQTYLATEVLKGSAPPQTWWTLVGVGSPMMIQDLGVHRRKDAVETVTAERMLMTLNHRLGFSLGILYLLKTTRAAMAINDEWEAQIIAELDSSLNDWRDQIPEHYHKDPVFVEQSATHAGAFAHARIVIHRSFIPMLHTASTIARDMYYGGKVMRRAYE
ncbi:hypothetical protein R3P38DRAFT_3177002 [Favolaschia claudopus]|uniref:Uncharacterized protein n=1 Tax=Favolaschia claudopus TaxID=2862362 RepID=A0AAW0D1U6_9AGAR